jgi:hypothetical protein
VYPLQFFLLYLLACTEALAGKVYGHLCTSLTGVTFGTGGGEWLVQQCACLCGVVVAGGPVKQLLCSASC